MVLSKWPRVRDMMLHAPQFSYQKMFLILGYTVCRYHSLTPNFSNYLFVYQKNCSKWQKFNSVHIWPFISRNSQNCQKYQEVSNKFDLWCISGYFWQFFVFLFINPQISVDFARILMRLWAKLILCNFLVNFARKQTNNVRN